MQTDNSQIDLSEVMAMTRRITRALHAAGRDALRRHKLEGRPIVVYREGKVVHIPADEIVIPPEV
jgi:hypothetical protein